MQKKNVIGDFVKRKHVTVKMPEANWHILKESNVYSKEAIAPP